MSFTEVFFVNSGAQDSADRKGADLRLRSAGIRFSCRNTWDVLLREQAVGAAVYDDDGLPLPRGTREPPSVRGLSNAPNTTAVSGITTPNPTPRIPGQQNSHDAGWDKG